MSFALTESQIMDGSKTVTRRLGWQFLKPGDFVRPVRKAMGLKHGEKVCVLRDPLRIVSVRRERLGALLDSMEYGFQEAALEGFGNHPEYRYPSAFVNFFIDTHKGSHLDMFVTRIAFSYDAD